MRFTDFDGSIPKSDAQGGGMGWGDRVFPVLAA